MELAAVLLLLVVVLGLIAAAPLLTRPVKRQPADTASGEHQRRHTGSAPPAHDPDRWRREK